MRMRIDEAGDERPIAEVDDRGATLDGIVPINDLLDTTIRDDDGDIVACWTARAIEKPSGLQDGPQTRCGAHRVSISGGTEMLSVGLIALEPRTEPTALACPEASAPHPSHP
jgi:hypothetical protein